MLWSRIFARKRPKPLPEPASPPSSPWADAFDATPAVAGAAHTADPDIRRYFHNQPGFQCYTSWFAHWGGWISAGHCVTDASGHVPDFASGAVVSWPDGLDAALAGCTLPNARPAAPRIGQAVEMIGFPAGARVAERRSGTVYHERMPGQWIAHITDPDEPVVTGMSGGAVVDATTRQPIGILITRNSPADLNNDRDPDESADFIALCDVWDAVRKTSPASGSV